jgi:hypothetical protein
MALKLVIAQVLDVDFIFFNENLYSMMFPMEDYFVIFRENATCSDSIGRWDLIFRHKDNLSQFLLKYDPADPGYTPIEEINKEKILDGIKNMNTFFDQAGIMEKDIIIGYAEVSPISQEKCQFNLYLEEEVKESIADSIFKAISNYIIRPRIITDKIDPKLTLSFEETLNEEQTGVKGVAAEKKEEKPDIYPFEAVNKALFPDEEIEPHDFKGQRRLDDIIYHFYKRKYTPQMIVEELRKKKINRKIGTIYNRTSELNKILGK